jgi:hypothetical protein
VRHTRAAQLAALVQLSIVVHELQVVLVKTRCAKCRSFGRPLCRLLKALCGPFSHHGLCVLACSCVSDQVTYKRLQDTLSVLAKPCGSTGTEKLPGLALVDVMFGARQPQFATAAPKWKANNTRLDDSQVSCSLPRLCCCIGCTAGVLLVQQIIATHAMIPCWLACQLMLRCKLHWTARLGC